MDPPAPTLPKSPAGIHRLVLAASAAGAVMTLCWAALQVRAAKDEARQAREQLAAAPAPDPHTSTSPGGLEPRLAEREVLAEAAAARVKELESVIAFLRRENEAAQKTIERLSGLERGAQPPPEPVKTKPPGKNPGR